MVQHTEKRSQAKHDGCTCRQETDNWNRGQQPFQRLLALEAPDLLSHFL